MSQGIRTNQPDQICRPDQTLLRRRLKKIARKGERPVHFGVVHTAAPRHAPLHSGQYILQKFLRHKHFWTKFGNFGHSDIVQPSSNIAYRQRWVYVARSLELHTFAQLWGNGPFASFLVLVAATLDGSRHSLTKK